MRSTLQRPLMDFYLNNAIKDTNDNQPIDLISVSLMAAYNCALDLLGENNSMGQRRTFN